ncbi:ComEC/Rec2 family competence protein [Peptostreptococcus russellii]|uniref:ComEC/Rec2 family competence protein n=1 Tax=Peptostreptococcus russellii TaxID=215200 RepID=UPI0029436130|nr:MBL fold metallo-hydrolase [Peptostreptococcus russellii]
MKNKLFSIIILFVFSILLVSCRENANELKLDIIDVDQGDSILVITPEKKSLLIDSGEEDFSRSVIRDLKKNRVKKLDYVIGTHSDSDHIGAMSDVLKEVGADKLILSKDNILKTELNNLISTAESMNVNLNRVESGDILKIDKDTVIYILSPSKISQDPNKNSIVLLLKFKNHSLIFTGDADSEIENKILQNYKLGHCEFLKAGHHGSKTSSSEKFIRTLRPDITAISCGYKNRYGHPSKDTLDTLSKYNSKIFRTDISGTLHFYFNDQGVFLSK